MYKVIYIGEGNDHFGDHFYASEKEANMAIQAMYAAGYRHDDPHGSFVAVPIDPMPIATLKSGLTVGNFASGHSITFDDGTVLEACSEERVTDLALRPCVEELDDPILPGCKIVKSTFYAHERVRGAATFYSNQVDILICSRPMMEALKSPDFMDTGEGGVQDFADPPKNARSLYGVNRMKKTFSSSKFYD